METIKKHSDWLYISGSEYSEWNLTTIKKSSHGPNHNRTTEKKTKVSTYMPHPHYHEYTQMMQTQYP